MRPIPPAAVLVAASLLLQGGAAIAGEWDLGGSASVELRAFTQDPAFPNQDDSTLTWSSALEPEFVHEWEAGNDRLTFVPFARWDSHDENRTHADIRTASWLHFGDGWDLVVGLDRVFWGVTESRHLVDIVNQTDAVENVDGEDKLGQPMVNLNIESQWGDISLFALPGFRERTFPASDARLSGPLPVAGEATYDSDAENKRTDFAIRWSKIFGDWDVGLSHFSGISREPRLLPGLDGGGQPVLIPHYDVIEQTGLDLQLTTERWLWKLEAFSRAGHGSRFIAVVGGFEYSFYGIFGTKADLGMIAEYLYDGRDQNGAAPHAAMQDDVFGGARLALNDEQSTEILLGAIVDRDSGATLLNLEASRRLSDRWKLELEGRFFANIPHDDPLAGIASDDHITVRLSLFF
jgi:hypothetical protein